MQSAPAQRTTTRGKASSAAASRPNSIADLGKPRREAAAAIAATERFGAQTWFDQAVEAPGSWWTTWADWLAQHRGREVKARRTLGGSGFEPLADAPGTYVKVRI